MKLDPDHPLAGLVALWLEKIKLAENYKREAFGKSADEARKYLEGDNRDWFDQIKRATGGSGLSMEDKTQEVKFAWHMSVNKTAELVDLFGPGLYYQNPTRLVTPRKFPRIDPLVAAQGNPMMAQMMMQDLQAKESVVRLRATLLESYLNYTPNELNLKWHTRLAIDDALVTGRGVVWTERYQPTGSKMALVGSFFGSVDEVLFDPDPDSTRDATWTARRCVHPCWQVEDQYSLPRGTIKGNLESFAASSKLELDDTQRTKRKNGTANDLVIYYKIYSKMGMGDRLAGAQKELQGTLDQFGDNVFLVVCPGIPYFLNLPPQLLAMPIAPPAPPPMPGMMPGMPGAGAPPGMPMGMDPMAQMGMGMQPDPMQILNQALAWPIPFWGDNEWPCSVLDFHPRTRCLWPRSHLSSAMGELQFMDLIMSKLGSKIITTLRDFIVLAEEMDDELRTAILSGDDLTVLPLKTSQSKSIQEVVQFLQHPEMHKDVLVFFDKVEQMFEQRTGLTEFLATGQTAHQWRSAEEAQTKRDMSQIRPQDMAQCVEDWQSSIARKEALAARWLLNPQTDIAPILGDLAGQLWGQLVSASDVETVTRELDYRIEAGSILKPNPERDRAQANAAGQVLLPIFAQIAMQAGQVGPFNAFVQLWCKQYGADPEPFMIQPPPPPMPPGPPGGGPPGKPPGGPPQPKGQP